MDTREPDVGNTQSHSIRSSQRAREPSLTRDFTLRGVISYLQRFIAAGYHCRTFDLNAVPQHGALFLRHDVDLDLDAAVAVAEAEAEAGILATYFLLMTSPLYNPFSAESTLKIRRLRELGHAIGLHYDPSAVVARDVRDHYRAIVNFGSALEQVSGGAVHAFSAHRPGTNGLTYPDRVEGLSNAYAPLFRTLIEFSSDSGGWWRFGRFTDSPAFAETRSVQLVLHPIWWDSAPGELPFDRLERLVENRRVIVQSQIAGSVSPYAAALSLDTDGVTRWPTDPAEMRP